MWEAVTWEGHDAQFVKRRLGRVSRVHFLVFLFMYILFFIICSQNFVLFFNVIVHFYASSFYTNPLKRSGRRPLVRVRI